MDFNPAGEIFEPTIFISETNFAYVCLAIVTFLKAWCYLTFEIVAFIAIYVFLNDQFTKLNKFLKVRYAEEKKDKQQQQQKNECNQILIQS
nr:ORF123 [Acipenserid herpesvirus 1]